MVCWRNLKSDGLDLIDWNIDWHRVLVEAILGLSLDEIAGGWSISMWDSSLGLISLNEGLWLWLGVLLVVVLLSVLVMLVMVLLVSRFLLGLSLLSNEILHMGLDHVLDLTIGQSLGTFAGL